MKIVHESKCKKHHQCESCEKSSLQAEGLKIHITTVHNGQKRSQM